nr:CUB domain-containing protein [Acidiferrobacterales bacterium]
DPNKVQVMSDRFVPKGSIGKHITSRMNSDTYAWNLSPVGVYKNLTLLNSVTGKPRESTVTFIDTLTSPQKLLWTGLVTDLPPKLEFEANQVKVELVTSRRADFEFQANYQFMPIDFEKRYCSERINVDQKQVLEDGSGQLNYAALSDCEWLIAGRDNHSVVIDFTALDISEEDTLHLFSGNTRQQRNLLMTLSGKKIPPSIKVNQGPVLLWFVSDEESQNQGFTAKVAWIKN